MEPEPVLLQSGKGGVPIPEVDLDKLYLYIQEQVQNTWQVKGEQLQQKIQQIQLPEGITREQVEAIVAAALAGETETLRGEIDSLSADLKGLLETRSSVLESRIAELEAEIKIASHQQKVLLGNFEQTKASFHSMSSEEKAEWAAASAALDAKLADLSVTVNELSTQNAALTALVGNCCRNNTLHLEETVRGHVISILTEMGTDDGSPLAGLLGAMGSQYVEKAELDRRMEAASTEIQGRVMALMAARLEDEEKERNKVMAQKEQEMAADLRLSAGDIGSVNEEMVKSIVDEALAQFSADRVGLPDFALESAGGSVLSVRCSETFYRKTALVSVFGLPLWYTSNSPRTVIQPNVLPGECWAFKGQSGYLVVQLSHPIQVTGFTLEHIPRSLAPRGDISSAPYKFSVFGLASEADTLGMNLGNYTYEDKGQPIQHYDVQNRHPGIFQLIELRVQTNHGNPEYTCIYRFRVHGLP
ncbi:SUN domain-containing protein 1 [Elysia marginata]|uniref:SUN domain-containing protein 1 n=1 Tax=Elysia marginata TaxID=1093978 RepID=A0AAV4HQF6_9GAST|nr:SUN domain-containing protein 1 [Elysia marginata]